MAYPRLTEEPGALGLAALIRNGALSPLEAVEAAIARIEALDGPINAVVVRDFDRARETARAMDRQHAAPGQPLFGVPMTVKESFDIAGLPSCWGLPEFAGQVAQRDARIVTRLKRAGAVILGKTNIPPHLADLQSDNPVYGRTSNPHDLSRVSGGSSGGGAAAVAAGMVPCEYGSDIGSSIRNPAHFCGVFGHKTSYGLVTKHGHGHPMARGRDGWGGVLSVVGPLARSARDLAALLEVTADLPLPRHDPKLAQCRFLAVLDHPSSEVDQAVRGPIEAALAALEAQGARVDRSSA
ncbi:MAG: amidase, partial [Sphingomonadales bacterium]|nr:amidase [Sphingomonadales bacterium]